MQRPAEMVKGLLFPFFLPETEGEVKKPGSLIGRAAAHKVAAVAPGMMKMPQGNDEAAGKGLIRVRRPFGKQLQSRFSRPPPLLQAGVELFLPVVLQNHGGLGHQVHMAFDLK